MPQASQQPVKYVHGSNTAENLIPINAAEEKHCEQARIVNLTFLELINASSFFIAPEEQTRGFYLL